MKKKEEYDVTNVKTTPFRAYVREHPKVQHKKTQGLFDFIILGAGVTGLSAAMYAARLGLKSLCLGSSSSSELALGGVITTTNVVENYPGFIRLTGTELADKIREHALSYDLVTVKEEKANEIKITKGRICIDEKMMERNIFTVSTEENSYSAKSILFATGTKWRKLEVPGAKEFENKGVAYCALCDGPLYRNKVVAVVGGSDSAAKDALLLAGHAKQVYMIYRGEQIHPEPINLARINANKKIEVINNTNVLEVQGSRAVERILLDKPHKGSKELKLEGVFVAIGHIVLSDLAIPLGIKLNEKGEIIINHKTSETNLQGVFAAGDVTDKPFKQAITGVADGCTASYSAWQYITQGRVAD